MADPLHIFVQALYVFGIFLEQVSPIPWPLGIAAFLPVYAMVLSFLVWLMRGRLWPLRCDYPHTTEDHPCRNRIRGEWYWCHKHNHKWRRKSDGHVIDPDLQRWEEKTPEGKKVERMDISGAGFLRLHSKSVTPLWHKGHARRPKMIKKFFPEFVRSKQKDWQDLRRQLRQAHFRWYKLLKPSAIRNQRNLSDRLLEAIKATRLTLLFAAFGLMLVIIAVSLRETTRPPIIILIEYISTVTLVVAGAIAKEGIWEGGRDWLYEARSETAKMCILLFFSAALLGLLDMTSKAVGAGF